mgnify:FL=1
MDIITFIEFIATVLTIYGVIVIAIPKRYGLWILIYAQVLWCIFAYVKNTPFFLFSSVFLLLFNFIGLYQWKKKGVGL